MKAEELAELEEEFREHPFIVGRPVCNLKENGPLEQRHRDAMKLAVYWEEVPEEWRHTVSRRGYGL